MERVEQSWLDQRIARRRAMTRRGLVSALTGTPFAGTRLAGGAPREPESSGAGYQGGLQPDAE